MAYPGRVDYHVHYYLDGCASPDMTLPVIDREARKMGLEEIAVLKHYSAALPNGEQDWVSWHVIKEDQFERYLQEMKDYQPAEGLKIFSGVETELVNDEGEINIPLAKQDLIDSIALSVHYIPKMAGVKEDFLYHPRAQAQLMETDDTAKKAMKRWMEQVRDLGSAYFIEQLVQGYVKAFEKYPKVHQASHMYDGLFPLRDYRIPYEELGEKKIIERMEPLMEAMVRYDVLWELLPEPIGNENILKRANEMGVRFIASADGHSINGTWGRFPDHAEAEALIDRLGLNKGIIHWEK